MLFGRGGDQTTAEESIASQAGTPYAESKLPQIPWRELQVSRVEFIDNGEGDFLVVADLDNYDYEQLTSAIHQIEALSGIDRVWAVTDGFAVSLEDDCDHAEVLQNLRAYVGSRKGLIAHVTLTHPATCFGCGTTHGQPDVWTAVLRLDVRLSDDEITALAEKLGQASGVDAVKGDKGTLVLEFSPVYAGNGKRAERATRTATYHAGIQVESVLTDTTQQEDPGVALANVLEMLLGSIPPSLQMI